MKDNLNIREIEARVSVLESKMSAVEPFSRITRIIYVAIFILQIVILFILLKR